MARYIKLKINKVDKEAWLGSGLIDRALKFENPKDGNIANVSTIRLLYHSLAYGDERNGLEPTVKLVDLYDWADERRKDYDKAANRFQIAFLKNMKTYLEEEDDRKKMDTAIKALTPEQAKKKIS